MKLAVIGLELKYQLHETLNWFTKAGAGVHSLCTGDTLEAHEFRRRFPCPRVDLPKDILRLADLPDGVLVGSIVSERENVTPLLQAGVPCYFFKQLGHYAPLVERLIASAQAGHAPIMGGSARRFAPAFRQVCELGRSGHLGRIVTAHRFEPHDTIPGSWQDRRETSGGYIVNFGLHCVESLCALLGTDVRSVHCVGGRYISDDILTEETCVITIQFRCGAIGIAEAFGSQAPFLATQPSFRVHGTKSSVEAHIDEGLVRAYRGAPLPDLPAYSYCAGATAAAAAFHEMIFSRKQPVPNEEILGIARILDLARTSYDTASSSVSV